MICPIKPQKFYVRHTVLQQAISTWCLANGFSGEQATKLYANVNDALLNIIETHYMAPAIYESTINMDPLNRYRVNERYLDILYSSFPGLENYIEQVKDFGEPSVTLEVQNNYLIVVVRVISPPTDYVGAITKLVDEAVERDEFIPYAVLRFIGRL